LRIKRDPDVLRGGIESMLSRSDLAPREMLQKITDYLAQNSDNCDWAGYYLVDPGSPRELVLGPFSGEPTEHRRIAFGEGVCGRAAETERTIVVDDVGEEENYLACSPEVGSEIVVPVFHEGVLVGELDIDSHEKEAFTEKHRAFLEWVADATAKLVSRLARS
jgi:GAF domain-containing protein